MNIIISLFNKKPNLNAIYYSFKNDKELGVKQFTI